MESKDVALSIATACQFFSIQRSNQMRIHDVLETESPEVLLPIINAHNETREEATRYKGYVSFVVSRYSLEEFRQHFRTTRLSFEVILTQIGNLPEFSETKRGRPSIPLEKKLLVTLWYLGNLESMRSIADRFDITKSSVYHCTRKVCKAVVQHFAHKFIVWATQSCRIYKKTVDGFQTGILKPGCIGCIDSTHIAIKAPRTQEAAYVNRKSYHSIILQCVCDHQRRFTDVFCGCAGSCHDATVLRSSPIYNEICQNSVKYFPNRNYILGDQAYPLEEWLLKKFQDNGKLSYNQIRFNKVLSSKRQLIEQAFGILKGRFRKLKLMDIDLTEDIPDIIVATTTFHNICIDNEDEVNFYLEFDEGDVGEQLNILQDRNQNVSATDMRNNVMRTIIGDN